jgi:hypothetical protein
MLDCHTPLRRDSDQVRPFTPRHQIRIHRQSTKVLEKLATADTVGVSRRFDLTVPRQRQRELEGHQNQSRDWTTN